MEVVRVVQFAEILAQALNWVTQGFPGTKNAGKLVKRCTENIKIVCTYVTAVDAGSSFPANHGKLFPQAFYARLGTELTNQSSQHQYST